MSHLCVFGCQAFAHVQKDKWKSFQPKSRKCIFLGYLVDYKGWKCWDPERNEVFISHDVRFVETEMPGLELGLPGPRYEPLSGVQPGSVGEPAGSATPPSSSSSSVPPLEPASTPSDDADSDSGSEPDLDDSNDANFVPPASPTPFVSSELDPVPSPDFPPSPSASPSPAVHSESSSPSPSPEPDHFTSSPVPPLDTRDSRTPPAPGAPYTTHSRHSSRPAGEWWKVPHPYNHARELRCSGHSGSSPESASEAAVIALEEANLLRTLSDAELVEYAFLTLGAEPRSYKEALK